MHNFSQAWSSSGSCCGSGGGGGCQIDLHLIIAPPIQFTSFFLPFDSMSWWDFIYFFLFSFAQSFARSFCDSKRFIFIIIHSLCVCFFSSPDSIQMQSVTCVIACVCENCQCCDYVNANYPSQLMIAKIWMEWRRNETTMTMLNNGPKPLQSLRVDNMPYREVSFA